MGEQISNPGGEQWLPSQHAMEGAYDYLGISSPEAGDDDGLAKRQYDLAAGADIKNASDATDNFTTYRPDTPSNN